MMEISGNWNEFISVFASTSRIAWAHKNSSPDFVPFFLLFFSFRFHFFYYGREKNILMGLGSGAKYHEILYDFN